MTTQVIKRETGLSWRELAILLGGRLVFNTGFRLLYPLLAFLSVGFGVSLQTASLLVTVQVAATLLSPLGGAFSDARGERAALIGGLALFCAGAVVCALAPSFWPFLAGYALIGLATALFMPAVQAYASNRSDYSQRGRVLGFLELSWALAAMVGVTGLALLVELRGTWGPAFAVLGAVGALMLALTLTLDYGRGSLEREGRLDREGRERKGLLAGMGAALRAPSVAATLAFVTLQMCAVELIFVAYAAWLEGDFGASTQQLGLVFGLVGLAELGGALGATLFTDRVGKRRAVLLGFTATGLLMLLLPSSAGNWGLFLVLFLLFGLCFEFAIVSIFPLVSGLGAGARGTVLALAVAASGLGRIVGSLAGPRLFAGAGFWANGLLAGAIALAGVALGWALVREGRD